MRGPLALLLLATASLTVGSIAVPTHAAPSTNQQDAALLAFLDKAYDDQIALSPESQAELGDKTNYGRLNDYTDAGRKRSQQLKEEQLRDMRAHFRPQELGEGPRVNFRLFEYEVERGRESFRFRNLHFPVSTNGSPAGDIPALLINNHKIDTLADANAYIARLRDTERVMREVSVMMREQAAAKIVPNKVNSRLPEPMRVRLLPVFRSTRGKSLRCWPIFGKKSRRSIFLPRRRTNCFRMRPPRSAVHFAKDTMSFYAGSTGSSRCRPATMAAWHLPGGAAYYADRLKNWTTINVGADLAAMGAAAKLVVGVTMFSRLVRALHGDPPALPSLPSLCWCVEMADAAGLCRGPSDGEDRLG